MAEMPKEITVLVGIRSAVAEMRERAAEKVRSYHFSGRHYVADQIMSLRLPEITEAEQECAHERQYSKRLEAEQEAEARRILDLEAENAALRKAIHAVKAAYDWWQVDPYDRSQGVVSDTIDEAAALLDKPQEAAHSGEQPTPSPCP